MKNFRLAGTSQMKRRSTEDAEFFLCKSFVDLSLLHATMGFHPLASGRRTWQGCRLPGLSRPTQASSKPPNTAKTFKVDGYLQAEEEKRETRFLCLWMTEEKM